MNILNIPENFPEIAKDENYFNLLKGLCYVVDHFGIDVIIEDLEEIQKEINNKEE